MNGHSSFVACNRTSDSVPKLKALVLPLSSGYVGTFEDVLPQVHARWFQLYFLPEVETRLVIDGSAYRPEDFASSE